MSMIGTCIWYNGTAEEAAEFYCGIIPNSKVIEKKYYLEGGPGVVGSVLTVLFTLDGTEYLALNGGPHYPLTPAMSIMVYCERKTRWTDTGVHCRKVVRKVSAVGSSTDSVFPGRSYHAS